MFRGKGREERAAGGGRWARGRGAAAAGAPGPRAVIPRPAVAHAHPARRTYPAQMANK